METKISVIIPTYRRPALLKRCLEALLIQRIDVEYEIIVVVDGAAEDIDLSVFHNSGIDRVKIFTQGKHCGPAAARNFGFDHAKGELVVFTDDDCIPDPDFLAKHWSAYINADTRLAAFTGKIYVPVPDYPTDYERNIAQLEKAEFVTANCAVTRDAFVLVGGFDETYTMAWREDSDLHFKLLHHGVPIIWVPDAIVTHPVRQVHWSVSLVSEKKNMFNALLYRKFPGMYAQRIKSKPPATYYAMVALLLAGITTLFIFPSAGLALLFCWIVLVIQFSLKRIRGTLCQPEHVVIMIVTSAVIPFLSIYWNTYGNVKFKSSLV